MATNSFDNPGAQTNQTINGTATADTLTGGLGNDTIYGGAGNDFLRGDTGVPGSWHYETFNFDFTSANGQAFNPAAFNTTTRTGSGYVTDFNEGGITNTMRGVPASTNAEDFGVIYTSTLNTTLGGTFRLTTSSDDGSTVQIFNSAGVALNFNNQTGGVRNYLNNDFHQGTTTRWGDVVLNPNETYTIQIRYWENRGADTLSATISGPATGGVQNLLTSPMLGLPPPPEYSVTGTPMGVQGNDQLFGGDGNDTLYGDGGNDTLFGGNNNDLLYGGTGNDVLNGDAGADTLYGDDGNDTLNGGNDNDLLFGGAGADSLNGDVGNDTLYGDAGNDTLNGGDGNDLLFGGADNDLLYGGINNDTLYGDAGADALFGGAGNDLLFGGTGNDTLNGGAGNNTMTGGAGDDTFIYTPGSTLTITDFNFGNSGSITDSNPSNNDFLDLSAYYASLRDLRNDFVDDGILNQSVGNYTTTTALGGTITLTGISATDLTRDNINVACFTLGTLIDTATGPRAIETLAPGTLVCTADHGLQPLRAVLSRDVPGDGRHAPVMFRAGALGNTRDMLTSPAHRMMITDWRAELLFGEGEVLVTARALLNDHSITRAPCARVTYYHLLLDSHEIVYAEGIATESYHHSAAVADAEVAAELHALFPDLAQSKTPSARLSLRGYEAATLLAAA
ncbi:Ca2+-binding protein, RTX toxin-related [Pseudorhodobacter antarcticus]|uniref:Ca2+-binding protein, RTX toxin-related n=1 Tax=Pseudorhodobacter antarcticus TaxID=1077947 RepID=A0A1H8C4P2_9RHOB|nr:Hint domain-containing protein [Pseudorhodobacter antarcticus]SEM89932.1 Ca2+-binding protein, RTX toxin-related [Pseudorhodobacter antarcticus]